jgi:hypothetical protein
MMCIPKRKRVQQQLSIIIDLKTKGIKQYRTNARKKGMILILPTHFQQI